MKTTLKIVLIFFTIKIFGSPQLPDYIIYKNDTIPTYNLILENYLQKQNPNEEKLFGLSFRGNENTAVSFNCWRGYQAIYEVKNDSLFLNKIIDCFGLIDKRKIDSKKSLAKMKEIFGDKVIKEKVFLNWFSENISFPKKVKNNETLRWDGVFYKIFKFETALNFFNGNLTSAKNVKNYEYIKGGINRIKKEKIAGILFKQLKKIKWNEENDCSEKYWITINEDGRISKVEMTYNEKEINDYFEKGEYEYCIDKIYNSLKNLQFDILKSKGIPISEKIYIEIWYDDKTKKLENWTE